MRTWIAIVCLALPLAGCVGYDGYGGYGYGARYGAPIAYDGFYDNYYGPIYDGYWGGGGAFYYRSHERGRWIRDRGNHFRQAPGGPGFNAFHGQGPGPRIGRPGGGRPGGFGRPGRGRR